jgi:hypothetical protein
MDLFAPNKDVNTYGARNKKNVSDGLFWWTVKVEMMIDLNMPWWNSTILID